MFFYIFINFIWGYLRLKKELNFYRRQNWKKIVRPRVKFCPPTGTCPPTAGTSTDGVYKLIITDGSDLQKIKHDSKLNSTLVSMLFIRE